MSERRQSYLAYIVRDTDNGKAAPMRISARNQRDAERWAQRYIGKRPDVREIALTPA